MVNFVTTAVWLAVRASLGATADSKLSCTGRQSDRLPQSCGTDSDRGVRWQRFGAGSGSKDVLKGRKSKRNKDENMEEGNIEAGKKSAR